MVWLNHNMILGVVGSRYPEDVLSYETFARQMTELCVYYKIGSCVSGGAAGIDSYVKRYCTEHHLPLVEYPVTAELYGRYGKRAPLERNTLIVQACQILLAYPRVSPPRHLQSRGTYDTIRKATIHGRPVIQVKI